MSIQTGRIALQRQLGYQFSRQELLEQALTHRSAGRVHNQRLEFLGDAVLGMLVADALYAQFPAASEGELSQRRSQVVNRDALAAFGRDLKLSELLVLGAGERKSGGRQRDSILCDAVEALIGGIYLDGGLAASRQVVERLLADYLEADGKQAKDPKTRLQEWMQAEGKPLPDYQVIDVQGEEHAQLFKVACRISLLDRATVGEGRSRKLAEQEAAGRALKLLEHATSGYSGENR